MYDSRMNRGEIAGQILGAGSALAGLILVFMGAAFTAFEGYTSEQKSAVRKKYQRRALVALAGFVASLLAAAIALASIWITGYPPLYCAVGMLGIAFVLALASAILSVLDLW